jgi:DNA-directed RNA polymerase alpha subunit
MDRDPHAIGLDELEIHERTRRILHFVQCGTVADILLFGRTELAKIPNCGPVTVRDIQQAVSRFGYGF